MSENRRSGDDRVPPTPLTDDELAARITRSLQGHAAVHTPDPAVVAARLRAAAGTRPGIVVPLRRGGRAVAATVVTGTLAVAGAGAAAAANPYSSVARAVEGAAQAVGIEWSFMPDGYTREQYDAFWNAGYDVPEMQALSELWQTDLIETKSRAGQMILDGVPLPVAPGSVAPKPAEDVWEDVDPTIAAAWPAFWEAGYTEADLQALVALWQQDVEEVKTRAGQMILDGQPLPIAPGSSTPTVYPPVEPGSN